MPLLDLGTKTRPWQAGQPQGLSHIHAVCGFELSPIFPYRIIHG